MYLITFVLIDFTVEIAKKLKIKTITHKKNKGYGGNQKTCYDAALKDGADIVVMIHPDYQYDPKILEDMIFPIATNRVKAVFASRFLYAKDPLKGGMPLYKYISNRFLTFIENVILRTNLSEFHTGYRSYSKELLKSINYRQLSDNFVFDTQIIIKIVLNKFRIREVPVETKYFKDASSIGFWPSVVYGLSILRELCKYILTKLKIYKFKIYTS